MLPDRGPTFYILKEDHSTRATEDPYEWTEAFETVDRRVARTEVTPDIVVSTVFVGLGVGWLPDSGGEQVIFETRVFTDYGELDGDRYTTWDQAIAGHEDVVRRMRERLEKGDAEKVG
jgi:hypothetical protein